MKDMKKNMKNTLKKAVTFGLCAVMAGSVAIGAYGVKDVQAVTQDDIKVSVSLEGEERNVGNMDVSDIVESAMPSVVSITTKTIQEVQNYYDYYGFFGYGDGYTTEREIEGSGSGIIIGKNEEMLLMATNNHVIEGATTVSVTFVDGTVCEAEIRGTDDDRDLAVVGVLLEDIEKETAEQISIIPMGNSDELKVGEQVVAIGNALGYGQSVTTGIVSAKNRRLDGTDGSSESEIDKRRVVNLIQTDAAINPGNSGGALLNMDGELVGINSAKMASTEVEGMCYAIAITDVEGILENLMNEVPREKVEDHGVIGITGSTVSSEAIQIYGIPEGVFISDITEDGPADDAGLKKNMVITMFDGKFISTIDELVALLEYYEVGEEIPVTVAIQAEDGYVEKEVVITLGENPNKEEPKEEVKEEVEEIPEDEFVEEDELTKEDIYRYFFGDDRNGDESMPDISEFFRR